MLREREVHSTRGRGRADTWTDRGSEIVRELWYVANNNFWFLASSRSVKCGNLDRFNANQSLPLYETLFRTLWNDEYVN